jgi:hypothetical protein
VIGVARRNLGEARKYASPLLELTLPARSRRSLVCPIAAIDGF